MAAKKQTKVSFDVSAHVIVPKHELCSAKERETVLKQYGASPLQMPRILITDPGIQHLGAEEGDLIKITRESPTAGETIFFRIVVTE